jgi:hypothetical protein
MAKAIYVVTVQKYPLGQKPPWLGLKKAGGEQYHTSGTKSSRTVSTHAIVMDDSNENLITSDLDANVLTPLKTDSP